MDTLMVTIPGGEQYHPGFTGPPTVDVEEYGEPEELGRQGKRLWVLNWTLNSHCFCQKRAGCFKVPSIKFMVFATIAAKSILPTESP